MGTEGVPGYDVLEETRRLVAASTSVVGRASFCPQPSAWWRPPLMLREG